MMNVFTLLAEAVATYQDIPALVTMFDNDPDTIFYYDPSIPEAPNYADALAKLQNPGMMISHLSTVFGLRGGIVQWRHTFRIDFKITAEPGTPNYGDVIAELVNGIPTSSDGLTVEQCSFDNLVDSMEDVVFVPAVDILGKVFYRMEFALQERGGQGS
jgi:hypothetical protein